MTQRRVGDLFIRAVVPSVVARPQRECVSAVPSELYKALRVFLSPQVPPCLLSSQSFWICLFCFAHRLTVRLTLTQSAHTQRHSLESGHELITRPMSTRVDCFERESHISVVSVICECTSVVPSHLSNITKLVRRTTTLKCTCIIIIRSHSLHLPITRLVPQSLHFGTPLKCRKCLPVFSPNCTAPVLSL